MDTHPTLPRRTETSQPYRPRVAMRALLELARHLRVGSLAIELPDGKRQEHQGQKEGPRGEIKILNDRMAQRFLQGGILGFCESYLDGEWESPDRLALFETTLRNEAVLQALIDGNPLYRLWQGWQHMFNRNNKRGSRRNIEAHYDLGNAFYAQWLDRSWTYSSALFGREAMPDPRLTLEAAQQLKYAALAERIGLSPTHRVLEIGCGWGGFAEYAAREVGCHVVGLTLSREQHRFAQERMQRAGLADKAEIRLQDYRDTEGTFDRIVSIEMIEAVGEAYWPVYFGAIHERLARGGRLGLQAIVIAERFWPVYRRGADFIQKHIFPGGMLLTLPILREQLAAAGLAFDACHPFGLHYAETLERWQQRFQAEWPAIAAQGFDERFKRLWELYLDYCAAGFKVGTVDVVQVSATRP